MFNLVLSLLLSVSNRVESGLLPAELFRGSNVDPSVSVCLQAEFDRVVFMSIRGFRRRTALPKNRWRSSHVGGSFLGHGSIESYNLHDSKADFDIPFDPELTEQLSKFPVARS